MKPTVRDFLYKVQKTVDKDQDEKISAILEGRKNVLNLKIIVIVDVSGSISRTQFCAFMSQINLIRGLSQVKVLEADTKVVAVYDYFKVNQNQVMRLQGGGGTDLVSAFEMAKKTKCDALLCMTDGCDMRNVKDPGIPVAWVLTQHGVKPYSWGTVCAKVDK